MQARIWRDRNGNKTATIITDAGSFTKQTNGLWPDLHRKGLGLHDLDRNERAEVIATSDSFTDRQKWIVGVLPTLRK